MIGGSGSIPLTRGAGSGSRRPKKYGSDGSRLGSGSATLISRVTDPETRHKLDPVRCTPFFLSRFESRDAYGTFQVKLKWICINNFYFSLFILFKYYKNEIYSSAVGSYCLSCLIWNIFWYFLFTSNVLPTYKIIFFLFKKVLINFNDFAHCLFARI